MWVNAKQVDSGYMPEGSNGGALYRHRRVSLSPIFRYCLTRVANLRRSLTF